MEKSEKSFYVIIENKKCGKFSGMSPIQVAKKVASKKLKSGKKTEISFHLDEVGGKKKKYGPYHGRKDKKTGKIEVSVVKKGKIMKGGVLTANDITKLQDAFRNNCQSLPNIPKKIINIPFGFIATKPLILFNLENTGQTVGTNSIQGNVWEYKYAVFEDTNGDIWIFFRNQSQNVLYMNFFEFFLNPDNLQFVSGNKNILLIILQNLNKLNKLNNQSTIGSQTYVNNQIPPELQRIIKHAIIIFEFLSNTNPTNVILRYSPNYLEPQIKKCVYSDLTFGILDGKNLYIGKTPTPTSNFQKFLIMKQPFFREPSEPVIFLRIQQVQQVQQLMFDIYIYKKNGNLILKKVYDEQNSEFLYSGQNYYLLKNIPNILEYCKILSSIPSEFGNFKTVRKTAADLIIKLQQQQFAQQQQQQQPFALQQQQFAQQQQLNLTALQQQQFAQQFAQQQPQYLNANMRKIRSQQKILEQQRLLQNLTNLKEELARLKIEQTRLNKPSVFPKLFISSINNPYPNLKLKPTNIPTIETQIEQIEQQIYNSMQSG